MGQAEPPIWRPDETEHDVPARPQIGPPSDRVTWFETARAAMKPSWRRSQHSAFDRRHDVIDIATGRQGEQLKFMPKPARIYQLYDLKSAVGPPAASDGSRCLSRSPAAPRLLD